MVAHCIYLILICLIFFQNVFSNDIITLSFKKDSPDLKGIPPSEIFQKLKENSLLTEIKLGNPPQKVELKLELTEYIFYIGGKNSLCKNKFIESNSETYKKISDVLYFTTYNMREAYLSSDLFYFYDKEKDSKEINFLLASETDKINYGGKLGLNIQDTDTKKYDNYNFIYILKTKEIIKDFYFFLKYNDDTSGNLIIGDLPHNFDESYNSKYFKDMYISMSTNVLTWNINLDSVFVADNKDSENKKIVGEKIYGYFKLELGIIIGTERYRLNLLNNFMTDKINKGLCFEDISAFYINYYCKEEVDIKQLNNLYFYIKDLDYTFELNYKDLFYNFKGKNYFLVVFPWYMGLQWRMGFPFFKKYQLIFDSDNKIIGIYDRIFEKKSIFLKFWKNNLIILFIIIIAFLIFYIIRNIKNKSRKIRANELNENYEYLPEIIENKLY